MRISPVNFCSNHMSQNAGQKVSFGMFGTHKDAEIARNGGMPEHKPELRDEIQKALKDVIEAKYKEDLERAKVDDEDERTEYFGKETYVSCVKREDDFYENHKGRKTFYMDLFEKSPHFVIYKDTDGVLRAQLVKKQYEQADEREKKILDAELPVEKRREPLEVDYSSLAPAFINSNLEAISKMISYLMDTSFIYLYRSEIISEPVEDRLKNMRAAYRRAGYNNQGE